ncbi:MAG: hypothetical protein R3362_11735 [Rhodothermales bacterium]|nr:hypothetical protein [Rhodothermales bacterium]
MRPAAALLCFALLAGCAGSDRTAAPDADVVTAFDVTDYLRTEGYPLTQIGLTRPLFSGAVGTAYEVANGELHLYEFDSEADARGRVGQVTARALGAGPVSVYQRGRLVVAYFGASLSVESALTQALGPRAL